MDTILSYLEEGDLRSIGRVPEVIEMVLADPTLFQLLIRAMIHQDPGVRMRSADAVEKISRERPDYLHPHKDFILSKVTKQTQQEVRWHLAQILPRLEWNERERQQVVEILFSFLDDSSKIVQTNSIQALAELVNDDADLYLRVRRVVEELIDTGSPAVKNRATKLLPKLVRKPT